MKFNKSKLNSKGFGHLEMIIAFVLIVAIATVGYFVYKHHQNSYSSKNSTATTTKPSSVKGSSISVNGKPLSSYVANAGTQNLTWIAGSNGFTVYACWTPEPAFGGVYDIQVYYWKPANSSAYASLIELNSKRTKELQHKTNINYYYNVVSGLSMDVSDLTPNDWVSMYEVQDWANTTFTYSYGNNFTVHGVHSGIAEC